MTDASTFLRVLAMVVLAAVAGVVHAQSPRTPGASFRLWQLDEPMSRLPTLVEGQTPNISGVIDLVEFGDADFFDVQDFFYVEVEGFLNIETPGEYEFRLVSDDGVEFLVNGEQVLISDRLQGATPTEGSVELSAGEHPFKIRYFENTGGATLSFFWRPPGTQTFELVEGGVMTCVADEVRVTSPGTKRIVIAGRVGEPGDRRPLRGVHPSMRLERARPAGFEPRVGGMDWLSDGRLVLCTWDPDGAVYIIDGYQNEPYDPEALGVTRFADGLAEPLGLTVVDDRVFVLQKQELTELIDHDGDGVADEYRAIAAGWEVTPNFHEFAFGLVYRDGFFYFNLAIAINPGGASTQPQAEGRGTTVRVNAGTGEYEFIAHGLRTPNGIGLTSERELIVTDNQGDWLPVSKLIQVDEGDFFGSRATINADALGLTEKPPIVWLPQGEIGNSPGEPTYFPAGSPFEGQLLHCDVTHGGLKRTFVERIDGQLQGAVFRFSQGFEAGLNRISWGPDGRLYAGGIGSSGNWGQAGKARFGLERLTPTGETAFEMIAVRAAANGLVLEFTEPLADEIGNGIDEYFIEQFRYVPTAEYGGPKVDQRSLDVASVGISADRLRVNLEIPGIEAGHVVYVRLPASFYSPGIGRLWTTEAWYTMNAVPSSPVLPRGPITVRTNNRLSETEAREGWQLLFDGEQTDRFTQWASDAPINWPIIDGTLQVRPGGGDIATAETFEDFELSLEWRVPERGNSGIFFNARPSDDAPFIWSSAPEMQILDNTGHPDGANPFTSAGANYAMHRPVRDVTRPVGSWNHARLVSRDGRVTHYLNGVELLSYELGSDDWHERRDASKFSSMPAYGRHRSGHIGLQDHGDRVQFRNIKVRRLD